MHDYLIVVFLTEYDIRSSEKQTTQIVQNYVFLIQHIYVILHCVTILKDVKN